MRIALVLGSGGARGWAHIGAIQEIEARGHEIVAVSGASIGALVGGVYGTGKLDEFTGWVTSLRKVDVRRLLDPALTGPGLFKGQRVLTEVSKITGTWNIEDLSVPFTAVASDLTTYREVWFQSGPLFLGVRASIAIPSFFTPVLLGDHLLADGGLVNPLPVEPTLGVDADATIAVSLGGAPINAPREIIRERIEESHNTFLARTRGTVQNSLESLQQGVQNVGDTLSAVGSSLTDAAFYQQIQEAVLSASRRFSLGLDANSPELRESEEDPDTPDELREQAPTDSASPSGLDSGPVESTNMQLRASTLPSTLKTTEVIDMSIEMMQQIIARYRAAAVPVTAQVNIPCDAADTFDFHEASRLIDMGREATVEALDRAGL